MHKHVHTFQGPAVLPNPFLFQYMWREIHYHVFTIYESTKSLPYCHKHYSLSTCENQLIYTATQACLSVEYIRAVAEVLQMGQISYRNPRFGEIFCQDFFSFVNSPTSSHTFGLKCLGKIIA